MTLLLASMSSAGWPVNAHSVAICEGLEDWGATDLSALSDSEDEDEDLPAPLVRLCCFQSRRAVYVFKFKHNLVFKENL